MEKMRNANFSDSDEFIISSLDQEGHIFPAVDIGNGSDDTEMSFLDTNYIIRYLKKLVKSKS